MKCLFLACCLLATARPLCAQSSFPNDFVGRWQGTLQWYQAGKRTPQTIAMQLVVQPSDSAGVFTWQLIYGETKADNRPYLLRAVDTARGHWQVDERNGILIDLFCTGNRLVSAFTVQSTTIVNSYWREGPALVVEFYSLTAKPLTTSGAGTAEAPTVQSYGSKGFQRAVLYRRPPKG